MDTLEEKTEISAPEWSAMCQLVGIAADWVWELDRDFRYTATVGTNNLDIHDSKQEGLLGKRLWETGVEILGAQSWQTHQAQLSSAEPFRNLLVQQRLPDGTIQYAHISGFPLVDKSNTLIGYRGIGIDVTQQKIEEEERRWFKAVIDTSPASIMITDIDNMRFLYANETTCKSNHKTQEELLAIHPGKMTGQTPSESAAFYKTVIAAGEKGVTSPPRLFTDASGKRKKYWELHRRAINIDGRWILSTISRDATGKLLSDEALQFVSQMYEARTALDEVIASTPPSLNELYQRACNQIAQYGQFSHVGLMMLSTDQRLLQTAASAGKSPHKLKSYILPVEHSPLHSNNLVELKTRADQELDIVENAYWTKQAVVSAQFQIESNANSLRSIIGDDGIASAVAIPLVSNNSTIGVIFLASNLRRAFSAKAIAIATLLAQKLAGSIEDYSRQKDIQQAEEVIRYMASRDALTGLPNRQVFDQHVQSELLRGERKKSRFAILFIDIDQFRTLNMKKGYIIGDKVLCTIATRLQENIPKHDVVTRINADRFLVLIRDARTAEQIDKIAQKLLKVITEPITIEGQPHSISACIGISAYPVNGQTERQLLTGALTATATAKKAQPNSIQHAAVIAS